ncbi:MAG: hypothetical protein RIF33_06680 [Cyclobacteriaceae bacterium]
MARVKTFGLLFIGLLWLTTAQAQEVTTVANDSVYHERAEGLISFLAYVLNTLGDANTTTRDKDVIITQSYAKIFRDSDVQIEDDLLENRQVVTNKDVTAYLKDVEFFFEDVSFDFTIIEIVEEVGEDDQSYIKVQLDRQLKGLTIEGDSIDNSQTRFVEISIDQAADELKIVSIYTTKVSRDEELRAWWNALSFEWRSIFMSKLGTVDSVSSAQLYELIDMDSLDLSNNPFLVDLSPLQLLDKLQYLNIDNVRTEDYSPLRYLSRLKTLSAAGCGLMTLEHLRYARDLQVLILSKNPLADSLDWSAFAKIQQLSIAETNLLNYGFLSQLTSLTHLDVQGNIDITSFAQFPTIPGLRELDLTKTNIASLDGISTFPGLERLILAGTLLSEIGAAASLKNLSYLNIQNTPVKTLSALNGTESLRDIQADNSQISQLEAAKFMAQHPDALVVVNTRENELWWRGLSVEWKAILRSKMSLGEAEEPSLEKIIRLFNITELDIAGRPIKEIAPLERFSQLTTLNISNTQISSLAFCEALGQLAVLEASAIPLSSLQGLENHPALTSINVSSTSIQQLQVLSNVPTLTELNIDNTLVKKEVAMLWQLDHPGQLVLFQTGKLQTWWSQLGPMLQQRMRTNLASEGEVDAQYLHQLVKSNSVSLSGREIMDLSSLQPFYNLRSLTLSETQITSLVGIEQFTRLEELECSKSPLYDIKSLPLMKSLKRLSIRDTPIDDLSTIASLRRLESLNCSGTNIKNLKGLEGLRALQILDCSNTQIKNLSPLSELRSLTELTCYNTRLSSKDVANFRDEHSRCKVSYY